MRGKGFSVVAVALPLLSPYEAGTGLGKEDEVFIVVGGLFVSLVVFVSVGNFFAKVKGNIGMCKGKGGKNAGCVWDLGAIWGNAPAGGDVDDFGASHGNAVVGGDVDDFGAIHGNAAVGGDVDDFGAIHGNAVAGG